MIKSLNLFKTILKLVFQLALLYNNGENKSRELVAVMQ
jgi:hypothetical protein